MRMNISAGTCLLGAALGIALWPPAAGAQVTDEQVHEAVKRRAEEMAAASDVTAILTARDGTIKDYRFYDSKAKGSLYAQDAAKLFTPLLDDPNPIKQINVAIAVSDMKQATIQPALDAMVASPNAAVRYLGWRCYRDTRVEILALGDKPREALFAALKSRCAAETSPVAIQTMVETARLPQSIGPRIGASTLQKAQQEAMAAMEIGWPRWCQEIIDDNAEMAGVAPEAVATLQELYQSLAPADDLKKKVLQRVYDMTYCSSSAYRKSGGKDLLADTNADLLRACEKVLGAISGVTDQPVQKALDIRDADRRIAMVGIEAIKWGERLKLPEPQFQPGATSKPAEPGAATQPETQPATQPTTGPATTQPAKPAPKPIPVPIPVPGGT